MSNPKFFQYAQSIDYALKANNARVTDSAYIKDYFRSMVIREDIFQQDVFYTSYTIKDGERPEQISYDVYGDEAYYWIILQVNGITNFYNEWPLSQQGLDKFIMKKYGSVQKINETHHWETVETKDSDGIIVLQGGLVVPEDYSYTYYDGSTVQLTSLPVPVTNSDYEHRINEEKEQITILDKRYIYDYEREYRNYLKRAPKQKSEIDISEL